MRWGRSVLSYGRIAVMITISAVVTIAAVFWVERRSPALAGTIGAAWLALIGAWLTARRITAQTKPRQMLLRNLGKDGQLSRVKDIPDPTRVGAHKAIPLPSGVERSPSYIPREIDHKLDEALQTGPGFVLLVGDSTAGKTRAAFEAMRRNLSDYSLVQPDHRSAIDYVVQMALRQRAAVVFLDDLEWFLGYEPGLTISRVDSLLVDACKKVFLLATMRRHEHARYHSTDDDQQSVQVLRSGRAVLARTNPIYLDRVWSPSELRSARAHAADDPRIADALAKSERFGVSEWLAAGPMLLSSWEDAWEAHPRAAAVIAAAVDARRAGYYSTLTVSLLRDLHGHYLEERGGDLLSPEPFDEALAWASKPQIGKISLLLRKLDGYLPFDYLVDEVTKRLRRVPNRTWEVVLDHSSASDAVSVGQAAYGWQLLGAAERAFRCALEGGISDAQEWLGLCLRDAGRPSHAADMFAQLAVERENQLGRDHHDTMLALHYHARALGEAGRHLEAARVMAELVDRSQHALDADDRDVLLIRHDHACYLARGGRPQEGARLLRTVLADRSRVLGPDDPDTLSARNNYACYLGETGKYEEAVWLLEEVLRDRLRVLGPEHPRSMNTRRHHARFLGRSGDPARAVHLLAELIEDSTRLLGPDHSDTLFTRRDHARFVGDTGHHDRAAELFSRVVVDSSQVVGGEHPDLTLVSRRYHAMNVAASGDPTAAIVLLDMLRQDSVQLCGNDNIDTLLARRDHARLLAETGDRDRAVVLIRHLAVDCERVLGTDHPDTQGVAVLLDAWRS